MCDDVTLKQGEEVCILKSMSEMNNRLFVSCIKLV